MLPLWDDEPHRRTPVVTMMLIVANLAVFGYQVSLALESSHAFRSWVMEYALVPARLTGHWDNEQQWLTVLTSMFLHSGVAHVLGNCWFLWVFGKGVEDRLGPVGMTFLYVLSGIAAAALQVGVDPASRVPMLGASGAISGVLGAYLVVFPGAWVYTLIPWIVPVLPIPAFLLLVVWFALQMWNGVGSLLTGETVDGGIAWWAHAGGFGAGLMATAWARAQGWVRRR